jgi:hypothetical protein
MLTNNSGGALNASAREGHEDVVLLLKGFHSMTTEGRKKLMNILKVFMLVESNILGGNS